MTKRRRFCDHCGELYVFRRAVPSRGFCSLKCRVAAWRKARARP